MSQKIKKSPATLSQLEIKPDEATSAERSDIEIKKPFSWLAVIASVLIAQMAGVLGSLFTAGSIPTWYVTLAKPTWNPPNWLFGPVWTILYTMMGVAAYMIWRLPPSQERHHALRLYAGQLLLNFFWTIIFFGQKNLGLALVEISVLWVAIVVTGILFYRLNKIAGWLMIPYLLWVSFAASLNFALFQLNR